MSQVVTIQEAETHLSRLIDQAHAGEEIILAKAGKPYARLMPLAAPQKRAAGRFKHLIIDETFFEPIPEDELQAWAGA